jgi:mxaL protein
VTLLSGLQQRFRMNLDAQLVLLLIAAALLLAALGRPTAELERDVYRYVFTFDVTQSMNVSDASLNGARVTRLEFARAAVRRTLEQLPCGSQLGLAIFTEHRSFLLFSPVEVCDNYTAISAMLDKVDWRMAWAARSEVAKGLYSSLSLAGSLGKETNNEGKVVGNWTARQVLQVDTYSLGRGANVEAEPMVGIDMSDVARRIAEGTEHLSSLREVYLQRLARETRLDYFRPETPQQLANWLTLRWVPGILATLSLLMAYVTVPAFRRTRSV